MPTLPDRARSMRHAATPAERCMWLILRSPPLDGWHFRRQVVFKPRFIADFASHAARLIVECDGAGHGLGWAGDAERDAWLRAQGFRVLRFANDFVLRERDAVWRTVVAACGAPPPRSAKTPRRPPLKGEG